MPRETIRIYRSQIPDSLQREDGVANDETFTSWNRREIVISGINDDPRVGEQISSMIINTEEDVLMILRNIAWQME